MFCKVFERKELSLPVNAVSSHVSPNFFVSKKVIRLQDYATRVVLVLAALDF
jgi:hypothetical protein